MKYDDASWHYGGNFPKGSPQEYGGTHIALLLKWCFVKGWAGEVHMQENPEDVERVRTGQKSATEFFFQWCDGKFTDEDLTKEGNAFLHSYYGENDKYTGDYARAFGNLMYVAPESDHDFSKFSRMIESRYQEFCKSAP